MRYDMTQSYEWNYSHSPDVETLTRKRDPDTPSGARAQSAKPGRWSFCGIPIAYPLGVAAGPLLNGRWVLHYAAQGFSVLTYKTVRSRERACYPLPNLQWIRESHVSNGQRVKATSERSGSWAISFGMPSMEPKVWRADVEWTRSRLPRDQVLAVSVVASPEPDWTITEIAADYATCAAWAFEAGADVVELNLSCPNVTSADGQLYRSPDNIASVLDGVRARVGSPPLIIKIGFVESSELTSQILEICHGRCHGIAMTNCLSCLVDDQQGPMFSGEPRGIGGLAIRKASVQQVQRFSNSKQELAITDIDLIGVGGISTAPDAAEYLDAGANSVQVASAVMQTDDLGYELRAAATDR
jgi:dihydroorotate dehydrogenase (NAD+) catalytic subunit